MLFLIHSSKKRGTCCPETMANNPTPDVARNSPSGMSAQEKQEMQIALKFADDSIEKMQSLVRKIENKWEISLWWDSKISNVYWRLYYFISLCNTSNREDIKDEISSYMKFYQEMLEISNKFHKEVAKSETEKKELQTDIDNLRKKLEKMLKEAQSGVETTSSSAVSRLHRGFITEYKKMEYMIKDMQIISLKEVVEIDNQKIVSLQKELDGSESRYDNLEKIFKEKLSQKLAEQEREQDRKLAEQKREQEQKLAEQKREQDQKLAEQKREQDQKLAEQREQMAKETRKFEEALARFEEQNKLILGQLGIIQENQANLEKDKRKLEEDKRKLEEEKKRLEIENDILLEMNSSNNSSSNNNSNK